MSIKRAKEVSRGPRRAESESSSLSPKTAERKWNWAKDVDAKTDESFVRYATTERFQKDTLLRHSKFGKGVVTHVEGAHIDVLFEEGSKKLMHAP